MQPPAAGSADREKSRNGTRVQGRARNRGEEAVSEQASVLGVWQCTRGADFSATVVTNYLETLQRREAAGLSRSETEARRW